ncbi:MAG: tyrosine-type recombinase/integrase [Planctomycetota bacterium]
MGCVRKDRRTGWYVGDYEDWQGNRVRKKLAHHKKTAEEMLHQIEDREAKIKNSEIKPLTPIKFDEFCVKYLEYKRNDPDVSLRYSKRLTTSINSLRPFFGKVELARIDRALIEEYKRSRLNKPSDVRQIKGSTINRDLSCLRNMFNEAIDWGHVRANPVAAKGKHKIFFKEAPAQNRHLPPEKINLLMNACADYLKIVVLFALCTGFRLGEILGLRWNDVDKIMGSVNLKERKWKTPLGMPLSHLIRNILDKVPRSPDNEYVFTDETGRPLVERTFESRWRRMVMDIGLKVGDNNDYLRFHDLRHSCGTYLSWMGYSIYQIRDYLGHRDIRTTLRYISSSGTQLMKPADELSKFVHGFIKNGDDKKRIRGNQVLAKIG